LLLLSSSSFLVLNVTPARDPGTKKQKIQQEFATN